MGTLGLLIDAYWRLATFAEWKTLTLSCTNCVPARFWKLGLVADGVSTLISALEIPRQEASWFSPGKESPELLVVVTDPWLVHPGRELGLDQERLLGVGEATALVRRGRSGRRHAEDEPGEGHGDAAQGGSPKPCAQERRRDHWSLRGSGMEPGVVGIGRVLALDHVRLE